MMRGAATSMLLRMGIPDSLASEPREGEWRPRTRSLGVSVVIPSYNHARFIGDAIASVWAQTCPPDEILLVDDGSSDHTARAIEPFADRIRCFFRRHEGVGATYNFGVHEARGDVVAFLESDDAWEPTYLEETLGFLERHGEVAWVSTARRFIDERGQPTGEEVRKRTEGIFFTLESCLRRDLGFSSTPVVRRECLLAVGPFHTQTFLPDNDMMLRFSLRYPMAHLDRALYLHRRHGANTSGDLLRNVLETTKILERFRAEHPELVAEQVRLLRRCLAKYQGMAGTFSLLNGGEALPEARRLLWQAVRNDPIRPKHWRRWIGGYVLGSNGYRWLRRLWRGNG